MKFSTASSGGATTDWLEVLHRLLDNPPDVRSLYWRTDHSFAIRMTSQVPFDDLRRCGIVAMDTLTGKLEQFGFRRVGGERLFRDERDDFHVFEDPSGAFVPFDPSAVPFMRPVFDSLGSYDAASSPTGSIIDHGQQTTPTTSRTPRHGSVEGHLSRSDIRRRLEEHKGALAPPSVPLSYSPPVFESYLPGLGFVASANCFRGDLFDSVSTTSASDCTPALSRSTSSDCSLSPFPHQPLQLSPWTPWVAEFENTTFPTLTLLEEPLLVPTTSSGPKNLAIVPPAPVPSDSRFLYPWSEVPPVFPRPTPFNFTQRDPASSDLSRHQSSFNLSWSSLQRPEEYNRVTLADPNIARSHAPVLDHPFGPPYISEFPRQLSYAPPASHNSTTTIFTSPAANPFPTLESTEIPQEQSSAGKGAGGGCRDYPFPPSPRETTRSLRQGGVDVPPPRSVLRPAAVRSSPLHLSHPYRVAPRSRTIHSRRENPTSSSSSSLAHGTVGRLERLASAASFSSLPLQRTFDNDVDYIGTDRSFIPTGASPFNPYPYPYPTAELGRRRVANASLDKILNPVPPPPTTRSPSSWSSTKEILLEQQQQTRTSQGASDLHQVVPSCPPPARARGALFSTERDLSAAFDTEFDGTGDRLVRHGLSDDSTDRRCPTATTWSKFSHDDDDDSAYDEDEDEDGTEDLSEPPSPLGSKRQDDQASKLSPLHHR